MCQAGHFRSLNDDHRIDSAKFIFDDEVSSYISSSGFHHLIMVLLDDLSRSVAGWASAGYSILTVGGRYRITVRVDTRMAEMGCQSVDEDVGGGVLGAFGVLVHLSAGIAKSFDQVRFDQPVPAAPCPTPAPHRAGSTRRVGMVHGRPGVLGQP